MKNPLLALGGLLVFGVFADLALDAFVQLIMIYLMINIVFGMSLNLVNGFTGQFSLGHAGFMAVGAYSSAYVSSLLPALNSGPSSLVIYPLLALVGGLFAAAAGWLVGQPSLRLRGDYLAIVTLGFGEIIRVVVLNSSALGGARGFFGIPGPQDFTFAGFTVSRFFQNYVSCVIWCLICFFTLWRIMRSAQGRAFLSVREDEIAAESLGINTTQAKVRAFVLSSFFAGVAGSMFAHYASYLNPASFGFNRSIEAVIIVVLGGMGSISGSILAAVFVTLMPELLRPLQQITGVDLRMVIYSLSLIVLMIVRPQGLFGSEELTDRIKRYVRRPS